MVDGATADNGPCAGVELAGVLAGSAAGSASATGVANVVQAPATASLNGQAYLDVQFNTYGANINPSTLVGREFTLIEAIVDGEGKAKVLDTVWRVAGANAPAGARVRVTGETARQWAQAMTEALASADIEAALANRINAAFGRMSQGMVAR